MPLIKARNSDHIAKSALVLDLGDLKRQADEIIAQARREAEEILAAAQTEADQLVATADARGFEIGRTRGLEEGRATGRVEGEAAARQEHDESIREVTSAWTATLERWEGEFGDMLVAAREDVLRFALAMARKIVLRVVETDPGVIDDQLAEALALLCGPRSVRVTVNPADRARVESALPALVERLGRSAHADLDEDPEVTRGGCVVRTDRGVIDARLETQLDRMVSTMIPERSSGDVGPAGDA
jgi:flagellar assembly protein FliH